MKKNVVLMFLVLLCFCACKHKPDAVVADAKKTCEEINSKLTDYKTKHTDDLTSKEPTSITGYYREEELKKIYAEYFGENHRSFTEYYFDDGMLICVSVQDFLYNRPNTYTEDKARQNNDTAWYDDKKTIQHSQSYYFSNNKMIKWIDNGKEIPPTDTGFISQEPKIWAYAIILIKELKEQDN